MVRDQTARIEAGAPVTVTAIGIASSQAFAYQDAKRLSRSANTIQLAESRKLLDKAEAVLKKGYSREQVYQTLIDLSMSKGISDYNFLVAVGHCSMRALTLLHGGPNFVFGKEPIGLLLVSGKDPHTLSVIVRQAICMNHRVMSAGMSIKDVLKNIYIVVAQELGLDLVQILHPSTRQALGL